MHNPWDDDSGKKDSHKDESADLKQVFSKFFDNKLNKNNKSEQVSNKKIFALVGFIVVCLWLSTGFFKIEADQQGVVLRFGKFVRQVGPGLNYKLPEPLEMVEKVSVTRIKKDVVGQLSNPISVSKFSFKDNKDQVAAADLSYPKESQMLTGDENIIDMHFFVQWRIEDATNYLFEIKDSFRDPIVRTAVESIMRQVIGGVNISEALSENRQAIEMSVKKDLQDVLRQYNSGIEIVGVGILYSYVAPEVRDAYRDVQSAKADKEKFINHAQAYRNELLPKAKGEARSVIESALAIKNSYIAQAEGEAKKFEEIYAAYVASKNITKKRMYLDTMQEVYSSSEKVVIDNSVSKSVLPFLPLNKNVNK
jgi:membrane protease subunit HflK